MLSKCLECGGMVSSEANTCPHCGFPVGRESKKLVRAEQIKVVKECAANYGRAAGPILSRIAKILLWIFLAGILGTIGTWISELVLSMGAFGWVGFLISYPFIITKPTLALSRKLIGTTFENIFSALCGTFCVASAVAIAEPMFARLTIGPDKVMIGVVGIGAALIWSSYFFNDRNGYVSPRWARITKRTIFILNILMAISFVLTLALAS